MSICEIGMSLDWESGIKGKDCPMGRDWGGWEGGSACVGRVARWAGPDERS